MIVGGAQTMPREAPQDDKELVDAEMDERRKRKPLKPGRYKPHKQ